MSVVTDLPVRADRAARKGKKVAQGAKQRIALLVDAVDAAAKTKIAQILLSGAAT